MGPFMRRRGKTPPELSSATQLSVDVQQQVYEATSVLAKKAGKKILELFTVLFEEMKEPQTLEQMVAAYSPLTTEVILKAKQENLKFVGGTFQIKMMGSEHVQLKMEAFFKNPAGSWVKKEASSNPPSRKFTTEAQDEIRKEGTLVFDLVDPEVTTSQVQYDV